MTVLEELKEYAKNCIEDKRINEYEDYISCRAHKWACQRFLDDTERKDAPFYWDEKAAGEIVAWFKYLRHSKGELSGQPITLNSWQKFILCQLYGWKNKETKRRRFKKSFFEVARKNAKSQMEGGVALFEAFVTAKRNDEVNEIYTAGTKRDQSKIVFEECSLMMKGSPVQMHFRSTREAVRCTDTESFIKPLSKQDGKNGDGSNPALLILDEYHQHRTTEFYDLGLGGNTKEPLLMIITTAGMDLTYPCYTIEYNYCKKILDPGNDVQDDEYLVDICELDPEDYEDPLRLEDHRLWHKANPIRMTYKEGYEKILGDWKIAKEQPEHMTAFLTKCMDIWVQAKENQYMDMGKWKACEKEACPIDLAGQPVYVGFDMSSKIDLTSIAFIIPYKTDERDEMGEPVIKYYAASHSFIPSWEKLNERILKDKVPYDAWERNGFITVTETPIVDQSAVMRYVLDTVEKYGLNIQCLCFDPANASKLMMDLSNEGYEVEEVWQSHKMLNETTQGFREQVYSGNVSYLPNPLLNYAMSNAVVKQLNGLIKIDKDATTKRIDPVDALLGAFKLAMYHDFDASDYGDYIDEFLAGLEA